jgi:hypothetical protein
MSRMINVISIFVIFLIFSIQQSSSKLHSSQDNFLLSSSVTEANAISDLGGSEAYSNSDSSVSLTQNSNLSKIEDNINHNGNSIIGLSDSKSNAVTDTGNAKASSTSNASAAKKEIIYDETSLNELNPTNPIENSDVVLAASNSRSNAATKHGNASSVAVTNTYVDDNSLNINTNEINEIGSPAITQNEASNLYSDCYEYNWADLEIEAKAISVNAHGILYYIDLDGELNKFEFVGKRSHKVKGKIQASVDSIVDINWEGTNLDSTHLRNLEKVTTGTAIDDVFVISKYGDGYYYESIEDRWIKLDGCIRDIAVTPKGDVYKLGCDYDENGYSVYRYICKALGFIDCYGKDGMVYHEFTENDECFWFKLDIRANKISVTDHETLYLIDGKNHSYFYDQNIFNLKKITEIKVKDMSVSNDGNLFLTGMDQMIYIISTNDDGENPSAIECFKSNATAISVGPINLPFIISDNGAVLFSSKFPFN